MAAIAGTRNVSADRSIGIAASWIKPDNIWVEMAWTVLEAVDDLDDEAAIEACQRIIDDHSNGDLPAQSDVNAVLGFLDARAH